MNPSIFFRIGLAALVVVVLGLQSASVQSDPVYFAGNPPPVAQEPLYVRASVPPLNMLVMGKDHKIYYEAYNDASDLDGDGILDVGYRGWELKNPVPTDGSSRYKIDYYGYFNSYVCYTWQTNRFVPAQATTNKMCSGGTHWSGDFLNYLTMSRMDALRRVLYGGWRHVDSGTETVLQGAFFPQDAHSWGKEYQSVARDGYDIRNYAAITTLPAQDRYHLFAVTTVTDTGAAFPDYTAPLFRVMTNAPYRVWNWLSIEGPVAGNYCFTEGNQRIHCTNPGNLALPAHPANRAAFDSMENQYAIDAYRYGSGSVTTINCNANNCNPHDASQDEFLTIFNGQIRKTGSSRYYQFRVDGDDAIDFEIYQSGSTSNPILNSRAGCYGGRGFGACSGGELSGAVDLGTSTGTVFAFKFRHEEAAGGEGYLLQFRTCSNSNVSSCSGSWTTMTGNTSGLVMQNTVRATYDLTPPSVTGVNRTDYAVRVQVCPSGAGNAALRDSICKAYGSTADPVYKPTGILHDYGETRKMMFGLITGSQRNNLEGGVLRSNIEDFNREINPNTGQYRTDVEGIVRSIDRLRMIGGAYGGSTTNNLNSDTNWNWASSRNGVGGNCESQGGRALNNGECRMWGNPIAEMLFEGLRYYAGAAGPTERFSSTGGSAEGIAEDTRLGLPSPTWRDPYSSRNNGLNYAQCARPHQTIISDINPSYDGNLPGTAFGTIGSDSALPGFDAAAEGQRIWNAEFGGSRNVFIGEIQGQTSDGAPTAKLASSFGNIRGLSPEEPTKQGTYYTASVARYGRNNDISAARGNQFVNTYSIALASPLPQISFPMGQQTVRLLPFAKTVSGTFGGNAQKPTNTIVDFYVESFANFPGQPLNASINGGRPRAVFRINYEDVEQGNDHDMDMIVRYTIVANANNTVTVTLDSEYAAGSANQNAGYVISGTTQDGIYLEVRDRDSPTDAYPGNGNGWRPYALNTPPGRNPGYCQSRETQECGLLPLTNTRVFTPGTAGIGTQLRDPLWYAAKYGAPDPANWDANGDGEPDNYFLVTNPLNLRAQLSAAFDNIANFNIGSGSQALTGARVGTGSFTVLPSFRRERNGKDWVGNLSAAAVNADGTLGATELWNAQSRLPGHGARNIRAVTRAGIGSGTASGRRIAQEFLGDNNNLGSTEGARFNAIGITTPPTTTPNAYGAVYSAADIVNYLRGDRSREASNGGSNTLRTRGSPLGSIINSEPVIVSPQADFGYGSYSVSATDMFAGYTGAGGYLETKASRDTMVYVGANDGMLHAFNGNTTPCAGPDGTTVACAGTGAGREVFAFIPNESLKRMGAYALPDALYDHQYYVDGQISVTDAKNAAGQWKTLLVGSTGGGGRGSVFALDVSTPGSFGNGDVLWELNNSYQLNDFDSDIGNVYGKPLLLPLENNRWGVLFGNGYGGKRSDPSLYIVDAFTGALIRKITANDGNPARRPSILAPLLGVVCDLVSLVINLDCTAQADAPFNGLGQITAIDRSGNGKVDTVYGGDLQGNLWKFDLSNTDSADNWGVAFNGRPLYTAQTGSGARQPITGGIRVSAGPGSGVMVYFGTGRYFIEGDNDLPASPDVQTIFGLFDNFGDETTGPIAGRSALSRQWIQSEATAAGGTTRDISRNQVSYYGNGAVRGWYLDLVISDANGTATGTPNGERFIATPRVQSGRVFFTTFSPVGNSCDPGGSNFVYALDLLSGSGALANVSVLGSGTPACTGANCGGVRVDQGGAPITSTSVAAINPTRFITNPACTPGVDCPSFEECQVVIYPGAFVLPRPCGRQSWRQLK